MIRFELTVTELRLLHELLKMQRDQARSLILKDSSPHKLWARP